MEKLETQPAEASQEPFEGAEVPFVGVLEEIKIQKNQVLQNIGYLDSIEVWEEMREKCKGALNEASGNEKNTLDQVLQDLDQKEVDAIDAKIHETLRDSGWEESKSIYETLLSKVTSSTLQDSLKNAFTETLSKNLEITLKHIEQKKWKEEKEQEEKNILQTVSYKKSIPLWSILIAKYENALKNTSLVKYQDQYQEKISQLQGKRFCAESYALIKATRHQKTGKNWKESYSIYTKLFSETKSKNRTILSDNEKKDLESELSKCIKITKTNIDLRETHSDLLEAEKKIYTLGYRRSKGYWEKMEGHYLRLSRKTTDKKYKKLFEEKYEEMQQNFFAADLHGKLEDAKEGEGWEASQKTYWKVLSVSEKKPLLRSEKHDIQACAWEYITTAKDNILVKEHLNKTQEIIAHAVEDSGWKDSEEIHTKEKKDLDLFMANIHTQLLSSTQKKGIESLSSDITQNIKTCVTEQEKEKQEEKMFSPESISAENPQFSYLWAVFLASQYAKKQQKSQISSQEEYQEMRHIPDFPNVFEGSVSEEDVYTNDGTIAKEDTVISSEHLEQQQREQKKILDSGTREEQENSSYIIDLNPQSVAEYDLSLEKQRLEHVIDNTQSIQLVHSGIGIELNSSASQQKYLSEAMQKTFDPENIHQKFSARDIESKISIRSSQPIFPDQIKNFL